MSGSGSNKEDAPTCETEETDSESYESQSPSLPGTAEPFYQKSAYELLLAGPDCREARWGEDG